MATIDAGSPSSRLVRTWLITAVSDALFSSVLSAFFYGSTVARLWQGVASVLLGPKELDAGMSGVLTGLVMHFGVALTWSTVFLLVYSQWRALREFVAGNGGMLAAAAVYGPCIWMFMSFVLIPSLTHKPTTITYKWWIQFFGHMVFVALPIVAGISGRFSKK